MVIIALQGIKSKFSVKNTYQVVWLKLLKPQKISFFLIKKQSLYMNFKNNILKLKRSIFNYKKRNK